ncbi:MAG: hypothetical protein KC561_04210, partial [Myxococcales bacterium]|nr:hypothetical protein [Myxococcales bacterium]
LSRQLIAIGECERSASRIRALLDSDVSAPSLRSDLLEAYEESLTCAVEAGVDSVVVTFEVRPDEAILVVDGESMGTERVTELAPGTHRLEARLTGYESETRSFSVPDDDDTFTAPLVELRAQSVSSRPAPKAVDWVMWGLGAVGIGTGTGLIIHATQEQDIIDNPPPGQVVLDPEGEQSRVDNTRIGGYVALGAGVAFVTTGLILFLTREESPEPTDLSWGVSPAPGGGGAWIDLRF